MGGRVVEEDDGSREGEGARRDLQKDDGRDAGPDVEAR